MRQTEAVGIQILDNDRRNKIAANHKKDIHADKAAAKCRKTRMKEYDGYYR